MILISAGTYDGILMGFSFEEINAETSEKSDDDSSTDDDVKKMPAAAMKTIFAYSKHLGCIKSIAAKGALLASGGSDEVIRISNVDKLVDFGDLSAHTSSITALDFCWNEASKRVTHLLSGAEDGDLVLWRVGDWQPIHRLKGHRGEISQVRFHPGGRLALSTAASAKEKSLRLWDLMRGTCAVKQKFQKSPTILEWSMSGSLFVIGFERLIIVRVTEGGDVSTEWNVPTTGRLVCASFSAWSENLLFLGDDKGYLHIVDVRMKRCMIDSTGTPPPKKRSKKMSPVNGSSQEETFVCREIALLSLSMKEGISKRIKAVLDVSSSYEEVQLVCVTSDGCFMYWTGKINEIREQAQTVTAQMSLLHDSGTRVTCATVSRIKKENAGVAREDGT